MRLLPLLLVLLAPLAGAAELLVELADGPRRYASAELLAHPASREIEIPADVSYKRAMRYRALPLAELLPGVRPGDHLQAVADDGFAAELPAAALLDAAGARAWLAVEDPAAPWPALGKAGRSAGPFYLVWTNPEAEQIGPEQWPFRMVRLRVFPAVAERFAGGLARAGVAEQRGDATAGQLQVDIQHEAGIVQAETGTDAIGRRAGRVGAVGGGEFQSCGHPRILHRISPAPP